DFCYAGKVGEIELKNARTTRVAASTLPPRQTQVFGLLASQSNEVSIEGPDFGGGHGAFTYFLLSGWNGAAGEPQTGKVTMGDLSDYVPHAVREGTNGSQHPKQIGSIDETRVLADLGKQGIAIEPLTGGALLASRRRRGAARGTPLAFEAPPTFSI